MSTGADGLVCSRKDSAGGFILFKKIKIWSSITFMESNMQQTVISTWVFPYILVWDELVKNKYFNWAPSVLWTLWVFVCLEFSLTNNRSDDLNYIKSQKEVFHCKSTAFWKKYVRAKVFSTDTRKLMVFFSKNRLL